MNWLICLYFIHFLVLLTAFIELHPGPSDGRDLPTHWDPRGHNPPHCQDLLQHLPSQPQPHQPDHRQGHTHSDAQCHLHTHGEPSGQSTLQLAWPWQIKWIHSPALVIINRITKLPRWKMARCLVSSVFNLGSHFVSYASRLWRPRNKRKSGSVCPKITPLQSLVLAHLGPTGRPPRSHAAPRHRKPILQI